MTKTLTPAPRNVRAILIQQQARAPRVELALPAILRNPFLLMLWMVILSTVVAALLLGRIRVPRVAHGLVIATADSLTPIILLPGWTRNLLHAGDLASVDTGTERLTVTIDTVDPSPLTLDAARRWLEAPNASPATVDTTMVVARLKPCASQRCPKLAAITRYAATAHLGTRSLASFAIPST